MVLSLLFVLFPGIVAYAIANRLSGYRNQPVNEVVVELTLHSAFVVLIYSLAALVPYFSLPNLLQLTVPILAEGRKADELAALASSAGKAIVAAFGIAIAWGIITALEREKKVIRMVGAKLGGIFQHNAIETAWHDALAEAGPASWIHVDTKDGRRFVGLIYAASWEQERGGLCLKRVHAWDEAEQKYNAVADWIYLRTDDIGGPLIFTKPERKK